MSDSPRWHLDGLPGTTGIVEVMLYDDHVAAVAAAGREGANQGYLNGVATNADNSFKAGVKAAREAIPDNDHRTDLDINDYDTATEYGLAIAKAAIGALEKP